MKTKKSETKSAAPAPAFDRTGNAVANWLKDTPKHTPEYEYVLLMLPPNCDGDDALQEIAITRTEYTGLKKHLASIREPGKLPMPGLERGRVPDWLQTPDGDFSLAVWGVGGPVQEIEVTRGEYISLKRHLATLRRSAKRAA